MRPRRPRRPDAHALGRRRRPNRADGWRRSRTCIRCGGAGASRDWRMHARAVQVRVRHSAVNPRRKVQRTVMVADCLHRWSFRTWPKPRLRATPDAPTARNPLTFLPRGRAAVAHVGTAPCRACLTGSGPGRRPGSRSRSGGRARLLIGSTMISRAGPSSPIGPPWCVRDPYGAAAARSGTYWASQSGGGLPIGTPFGPIRTHGILGFRARAHCSARRTRRLTAPRWPGDRARRRPRGAGPGASRSVRLSSTALVATTIELIVISSAAPLCVLELQRGPRAGYTAPAATGIASRL
jgi:hypothetical protein